MFKRYKKNKPKKVKGADLVAEFYKKEKHYTSLLNECKKIKFTPKVKSVKKLEFKSNITKGYKASLGEKLISVYLIKNHINYRREVLFQSLPRLRFDFYLPKQKICIEFDGEQHFKYVDKFDNGDKDALYIRKNNDRRKNLFCKNNELKLIRIPYNKINEIENILTSVLKHTK